MEFIITNEKIILKNIILIVVFKILSNKFDIKTIIFFQFKKI